MELQNAAGATRAVLRQLKAAIPAKNDSRMTILALSNIPRAKPLVKPLQRSPNAASLQPLVDVFNRLGVMGSWEGVGRKGDCARTLEPSINKLVLQLGGGTARSSAALPRRGELGLKARFVYVQRGGGVRRRLFERRGAVDEGGSGEWVAASSRPWIRRVPDADPSRRVARRRRRSGDRRAPRRRRRSGERGAGSAPRGGDAETRRRCARRGGGGATRRRRTRAREGTSATPSRGPRRSRSRS